MPRTYKDLIVNEPDGLARVKLIDRKGEAVLEDVRMELSSNILQRGDRFGAMAANRLLELDEDGTPLLNINGGTFSDKPGKIQLNRQDGSTALPASCSPGEPLVMADGTLYVGNKDGKPVQQATKAKVDEVQSNLDTFIGRRDNPHKVTCTQIGAATTGDLADHVKQRNPHNLQLSDLSGASLDALNKHTNTKSGNPHNVTYADVKALSTERGGDVKGSIWLRHDEYWAWQQSNSNGKYIGMGINLDGRLCYIGSNASAGLSIVNVTGTEQLDMFVGSVSSDGDVSATGNFYSGSWGSPSKREWKDVLGSFDEYENRLRLLKANVVRYKYNDAAKAVVKDKTEHTGLIVEELLEVAPEYVYNDKEGKPQGILYGNMISELLGLIQYQNEQMEKQQGKLDKLDKQICRLQKRIEKLEKSA